MTNYRPLNKARSRMHSWMHRYDAARAAIDPETGERITAPAEREHYQHLVDNSWAIRY